MIASLIDSLATGGVLAYQTYSDDQISKRDSKARRAELARLAEMKEKEAEFAALTAPLRTKQVQYVVGGVAAVTGLGIAAYLIYKLAKR
jgi:hypothetical protein